jgi:tetratricopeptide (TPR) repeat protein
VVIINQQAQPSDDGQYLKLKEMGDCYAALSDTDRARQCYQAAADLTPDRPEAHVGLGALAVQSEDFDAALLAFHKARVLEPACAEAYAGLAMVSQHRQDFSAAFDWYLKCLECDGDNLAALLGLFQASCRMGTFAKIINYLEIYLRKHADDTSVLFCLSTLYARDGKLNLARSAVMQVLAAEPGKPEAHELLCQIERRLTQAAVG